MAFCKSVVSCPCLAAFLLVAGCGSDPLAPPQVNAQSAAAAAIKEYDTDKNGRLDESELEKAPALNAAKTSIDSNGDNTLSAGEIAARVSKIVGDEVGLLQFHCDVTLDGQPLEGATFQAIPEKWLGPQFKVATGVSEKTGRIRPAMEVDGYHGMQCGIFRVEISKIVDGQETIPARYNKDTTLGMEIALDLPTTERGMIFKLTTKESPPKP